jgi:spermidine synthase
VKKWTTLERALTPDGKTISLEEHDGSYAIRVDGIPLMSTRQHASEEKLAELACAHLREMRGARVLIGGLGFGFTLKAALASLPADANVVVAELLGAVIAWNRDPELPLASKALADSRVTVRQEDAGIVIRRAREAFDSIILDVDNGPAALSTEDNAGLYDSAGLRQARAALRPGGCVAFWSVAPDTAFQRRLEQAGFGVEVQRCRSHGNSGRWHTLFLGRR